MLGLSGGVDSSVAAALIHKAIGDRLTCVFVDHGLLRSERSRAGDGHVRAQSRRARDPRRRRRRNSSPRSPASTIPERKRKIIGKLFVDVFQREAAKLDAA